METNGKSLQKRLEAYESSDFYPFHMPGHKRNTKMLRMGNPYGLDITEIHDFDNLHMAEGVLKNIMDKAAALYSARRTYLLVNGSTGGILAGINACTRHGDKIIVARNSHRSVYHGLLINELKPVYIYPHLVEDWGINGPILPADVDKCLNEHPDAKMVIITSPTYEGIVSDIGAIAKIAHRRGIPLMVDEAHGAHFGFHSYFPKNSVEKGADLVIHSVHKTLPAFTQTALLHMGGNLVSDKKVQAYGAAYQTSSPSYILMAGIENCLGFLEKKEMYFESYKGYLEEFYMKTLDFTHIRVFNPAAAREKRLIKDPSKLVISVKNTNLSGHELHVLLREKYHLEMEAEYTDYVIGMTSIGDRKEGMDRLYLALKEIDRRCTAVRRDCGTVSYPVFPMACTPYEAEGKDGIAVPLSESEGLTAKESVFLYPPGIPIIVPGEVITRELEIMITSYIRKGLEVKGLLKPGWIEVAKNAGII